MTKPGITVRALRPADIDKFIALTESREGFDRTMAEHRAAIVEWIAFRNPAADGGPSYFVGDDGGRLVSHMGRMPTRFVVNGAIETGSYIHDLYVLPEVRAQSGQGFFLTMNMYRAAEEASAGFCVLIWTNEINIALQQSRHYTEMWTHRYSKLIGADMRIDDNLPRSIARYGKPVARRILSGIDRLRGIGRDKSFSIERLDFFDSGFDDFAASASQGLGVAPYKDAAYLNWKYIQRPGLDAVAYVARDIQGRMVGYSVIATQGETYRGIFIAELVAAGNDANLIRQLVDEAIEHARRAEAEKVFAVATAAPYAEALRSRLFRLRPSPEPLFLAKETASQNREILQGIQNWHLSFGDSEGPI